MHKQVPFLLMAWLMSTSIEAHRSFGQEQGGQNPVELTSNEKFSLNSSHSSESGSQKTSDSTPAQFPYSALLTTPAEEGPDGSRNKDNNNTLEESPSDTNEVQQQQDSDSLRVEAYKSKQVQLRLRETKAAFEKLAQQILKTLENDNQYQTLLQRIIPSQSKELDFAKQQAVERALQTPQIKKLKDQAQRHFEKYRQAYRTALATKKEK